MKAILWLTGGVLFMTMASCGPGKKEREAKEKADSIRARAFRTQPRAREQYAANVKEAEAKMRASQSGEFNPEIANALIKAYLDYANTFTGDTLAPDYFYRAGEIAARGGNYDQAIFLFNTVADKYSEYKYVVEAMYEEAMIYDSKLPGNDAKAKVIYEQIIRNYPKHKLAEDAKIAIANLGKSDEELVKEFEKKNHMK